MRSLLPGPAPQKLKTKKERALTSQLSVVMYAGRQQLMAQVVGLLSPPWETWIELLASGY